MRKTTVSGPSLRKAGLEDKAFLLEVRNSPEVRLQSKTQELIAESTHEEWFHTQLISPGSMIWILEHQGQREGYLRAQENESGRWVLSIALQTGVHGKGHGSWAVGEGCQLLRDRYGAKSVVAEVLAGNTVARRLFNGLGFAEKAVLREGALDLVRFEKAFDVSRDKEIGGASRG